MVRVTDQSSQDKTRPRKAGPWPLAKNVVELVKPPFGPPTHGVRCATCSRYFAQKWFWNKKARVFRKNCPHCLGHVR